MQRELIIGPSFEDLRPIRAVETTRLPIFPELARILAGQSVIDPLTKAPFDCGAVARYVCAVLSAWVYSDLETVATIMTRLGLERSRCRSIEISNNGSLVRSTGYLVQSWDRKVALLAYRGTDPFDLSTWAVNADLNPSTVIWPAPAANPTRPQPGPDKPAASHGLGALVGLALGATEALAGKVEHVASALGLGTITKPALESVQLTFRVISAVAGSTFSAERPPEFVKRDAAHVHAGFYRNQRVSWFDLADCLRRAITSGDIFRPSEQPTRLEFADAVSDEHDPPEENRLEHIYLTGHSQGAAMALIAAFRIATEPAYEKLQPRLQHVYAFAPPRVGNVGFAKWFEQHLKDKVSCFVYRKDVVPHLPPLIERSLEFTHVGNFFEVPANENRSADEVSWVPCSSAPERATSAGQLLLAFTASFGENLDLVRALLSILRFPVAERVLAGLGEGLLEDRQYVLYDHLPVHYVAVSQLDNRKHVTELGGDF